MPNIVVIGGSPGSINPLELILGGLPADFPAVPRYLSNVLGWHWALDGERIASPERFLRAAIGIFHR